MVHRIISYIALLGLLLSLAGNAQASPSFPLADATALVYVAIPGDKDLASFESTGLPAYALLKGRGGAYLLTGADPTEQRTLRAAGLDIRVLDPDMRGASYYLAYLMPGYPTPTWSAYGQLLQDEGDRVLLRTSPADAERLPQAGVELQAITFTPKPLHPVSPALEAPTAITPDPLIQTMIDQVDGGTVYQYTGDLSGEWPVDVGGQPYTIYTRHTNSGVPIQKATQFVGEHLGALGLAVEYHQWGGATYPNVIGEMTGLINPDDIFIIGAHLDDMPSSGNAPGADDNASGSVATIIAADILTQYQWGCTLRFALWTGEEQGLNGSEAYALRSYNSGENIVGYLNLDMIAWNTGGSPPDIDLHATSSIPETLVLAQLFADVVDAYNLNLIPQIIPNGTGASDHAAFWQYGYTAILGIEDNSDFNPYYHTINDDLDNLQDLPYYYEFVKAAVGTFAHMTDCLIPSGTGHLDGTVTDASSASPIEGATVSAVDGAGHTFPATTYASGYYTQTLLAGTYTVTASAFGYQPAISAGVVVTTDTVTTQDFALWPSTEYVVSGTVTEAGTGIPLYAQVEVLDTPLSPVWTDPETGYYSITVPESTDTYTFRVSAAMHLPEEREVLVDQDQTQDFTLYPLPCILLVDDDNNAPDMLPYFTAALDNLGYNYNVFDVGGGGGDGPALADMQGYQMVIWFSGDKFGGSAGPNADDETALAAYLDGGGKLFLSSQDYLYDFGLTTFGQTYLGIGTYDNDTGNASTKYGVAGDPIGDGLGPYTLIYPAGFTDYGDIVNAGAGASVAFRSSAAGGNNLDVDKGGGNWQTVFFGTSWVPVYNASAANGQAVLDRIIEWFGGCECLPLSIESLESDSPVELGQTMHFSAAVFGDTPITYDWDFGGSGTPGGTDTNPTFLYDFMGTYTVTLDVSNACPSFDSASLQVSVFPPEAAWEKALWINGAGPFGAAEGPFEVSPGDEVVIVDQVYVTSTLEAAFTLNEVWDEALTLAGWEAPVGNVITGTGVLTWEVSGGAAHTWQAITKTFTVMPGMWESGLLTETLWVERLAEQPDPIVLALNNTAIDLALVKSDAEDPVFVGSMLTYTLSITNHGPHTATGVLLTDTLPVSVTFVSASQGCTHTTGVVTCALGELPAGESVRVELVVIAPGTPMTITNHAEVVANEFDLDPMDNTSSEDTLVIVPPPPEVKKIFFPITARNP